MGVIASIRPIESIGINILVALLGLIIRVVVIPYGDRVIADKEFRHGTIWGGGPVRDLPW